MTIHMWKHWFWITALHHSMVLILVTVDQGCAEAGLHNETASSHYELATTTPETVSDEPGFYLPSNSDMDDTFNGENSDIVFPIPIKKYSVPKKFRLKTKTEEVVSEKVINFVEEKYDVSIKRLVSSTVIPTASVAPPMNISSSNETDEALGDDPLDATVSTVQNTTEDLGPVTSVESFDLEGKMAVAAATTVEHGVRNSGALDAGSITGITLGIVVISGLFGAISFVLYRRRYLNKPQVLNDKSSTLDSSGYIDDASLRENSEEMYSLDNDSFLNSLEAMTIQNYWTESVKHTKL